MEISSRYQVTVTSGALNDNAYLEYLKKYASSNRTYRYLEKKNVVMTLCKASNKPCNGIISLKFFSILYGVLLI